MGSSYFVMNAGAPELVAASGVVSENLGGLEHSHEHHKPSVISLRQGVEPLVRMLIPSQDFANLGGDEFCKDRFSLTLCEKFVLGWWLSEAKCRCWVKSRACFMMAGLGP